MIERNGASNLGAAVISFGLDGTETYEYVNRALAQMNGLPIEDHVGRSPAEVIPEAYERDGLKELMRRVKEGELVDEVREWTDRTGRKQVSRCRYQGFGHAEYPALFPNDGRVYGMIALVADSPCPVPDAISTMVQSIVRTAVLRIASAARVQEVS